MRKFKFGPFTLKTQAVSSDLFNPPLRSIFEFASQEDKPALKFAVDYQMTASQAKKAKPFKTLAVKTDTNTPIDNYHISLKLLSGATVLKEQNKLGKLIITLKTADHRKSDFPVVVEIRMTPKKCRYKVVGLNDQGVAAGHPIFNQTFDINKLSLSQLDVIERSHPVIKHAIQAGSKALKYIEAIGKNVDESDAHFSMLGQMQKVSPNILRLRYWQKHGNVARKQVLGLGSQWAAASISRQQSKYLRVNTGSFQDPSELGINIIKENSKRSVR